MNNNNNNCEVLANNGLTGAVDPIRIIELSKKIRDLKASLEKERLKSNQLSERLKILEAGSEQASLGKSKTDEELVSHLKSYQKRLSKCEELVNTLRDKNCSLSRELKVAQKVLEAETGESMNLSMWWKKLQSPQDTEVGTGKITQGWRGRHQQIILLKEQVRSLESKLKILAQIQQPILPDVDEMPDNFTGATTLDPLKLCRHTTSISTENLMSDLSLANNRTSRTQYPRTKQLESENKEMKEEVSSLRTKIERFKAKEKNTSNQLNDLKGKIDKLLEKSKHDDELIQSLAEVQTGLKGALSEAHGKLKEMECEHKLQTDTFAGTEARMKSEINQLHQIAREKDEKIIKLEKELSEFAKNPTAQTKHSDAASEDENGGIRAREIGLLTTERDGLREMVKNLNQRLDRVMEDNRELQRELKVLDKPPVRTGDSFTRKQTRQSQVLYDKSMTVEEWLDGFIESDHTHRSTENRIATGKKDPLKAIRRAREEISSLKLMNQKLLQEKQDVIANFMRLSDELRGHMNTQDGLKD